MLKTHIIRDRNEIEKILPQCIELAKKSGAVLPSNYMWPSFLWGKHFSSKNGEILAKKRGANFLGVQSWLNGLQFLVSEEEGHICGAVPLASFLVKLRGNERQIQIISFPGDIQLVPYQDFLILPQKREIVLSSIFSELLRLINKECDLIFLGYIPDRSENIPILRKILSQIRENRLLSSEKITSRRGGVWPWTVDSLVIYLTKAAKRIENDKSTYKELEDVIGRLRKCRNVNLLFPSTRKRLELEIRGFLKKIENKENLHSEIETISRLLSPDPIIYPYILLPSDRDLYLTTLSRDTRRYFRRRKRVFGEQGGYFEKISGEEVTEHDIDDYLNLHLMLWGEESTALKSDASFDFHRDIALTMARLGMFTLFFACYNGERIAAHSCFDIHSRREAYLTGRNPEFGELGAGRLLYMETIYDAIDNRFGIYDLGQGWFSYKWSFTNTWALTHNFFISRKGEFPDLDKIFIGYEYMSLNTGELDN